MQGIEAACPGFQRTRRKKEDEILNGNTTTEDKHESYNMKKIPQSNELRL